MGELPDIRDKVYVCGFPVGGDEISISEGVVSRIEIQVWDELIFSLSLQVFTFLCHI